VAVLPEPKQHEFHLDEKEIEITTKRGSGPGGQHKNKTDSCVVVKHIPTGITAMVDGRDQHKNKALAKQILCARLLDNQRKCDILERNQNRKQQLGCGMRGDKRRTIRVNDNQVVDHILGKTLTYKEYQKGNFDGLVQ
jgi:peptide chain release factor 1